jgi:hypothetical protein
LRYNGASPYVIIPDSVMEIKDNAFAGCDNLQTVHFPDALKKIGGYAFSECTSLKALELPYSVEEIGPYAFNGCFMMDSVKMPLILCCFSVFRIWACMWSRASITFTPTRAL